MATMVHGIRVFKHGKYYHLQLPDGRKQTTKQTTKRKAEIVARMVADQLETGEKPDMGMTFKKLWGEYQRWARTRIEEGTLTTYGHAVAHAYKIFGADAVLDDITEKDGEEYVTRLMERGLKPSTVRSYVSAIRSVLTRARRWGYLRANPFEDVTPPKLAKRVPKYIPAHEVAQFVQGIVDQDHKHMIVTALVTGRRRVELAGLRWERIDMERGIYQVITKGGDEKVFPIHPVFRAVLEERKPKKQRGYVFPWRGLSRYSHIAKDALVAAGLGHLSLHSLRHTFATMLAESGTTDSQIQELMGHASPESTRIYTHIGAATRNRAISQLNYGDFALETVHDMEAVAHDRFSTAK